MDIKRKKKKLKDQENHNGIIIRKDEVSWKANLEIDMYKPEIKKKRGGALNDRY